MSKRNGAANNDAASSASSVASTTVATKKKSHKKKKPENGSVKAEPVEGSAFGEPGPSTSAEPPPSRMFIPLRSLNPYITCSLCDGYLIDAITVVDCLHTFCKSCLLTYFEDNNDCPKCHLLIHQSHPTHYVAFDRTMQEIVYKLVPGLQEAEMKRREEWVEERRRLGLPTDDEDDSDEETDRTKRRRLRNKRAGSEQKNGSAAASRNGIAVKAEMNGNNGETPTAPPLAAQNGDVPQQCCTEADAVQSHHRTDSGIVIRLVSADDSVSIQRQFIRLSGYATINTLKRALASFLRDGDISRYHEYDIFCNEELMGRDYSMMFIHKTRWRNRAPDEPLLLVYKLHEEF